MVAALFGLEHNWLGDIQTNSHVLTTLASLQAVEKVGRFRGVAMLIGGLFIIIYQCDEIISCMTHRARGAEPVSAQGRMARWS